MSETTRYKYPLKLPASLKETAARLAKEDGVSLNQWIATAVAQKIGAVETAADFFERRGARSTPNAPQSRPGTSHSLGTGSPPAQPRRPCAEQPPAVANAPSGRCPSQGLKRHLERAPAAPPQPGDERPDA